MIHPLGDRERAAYNTDHDQFDLFTAAALMGCIAEVDLQVDGLRQKVQALADEVKAQLAEKDDPSWPGPLIALGEVLFDRHSFKSVEPSSSPSFLHTAFASKRGSPLVLAVLTREVARRVGLEADILRLPKTMTPSFGLVGVHQVTASGERDLIVLDPFAGGRLRSAEDLTRRLRLEGDRQVQLCAQHLAPASADAILAGLLLEVLANFERGAFLQAQESVLERLLLLDPSEPTPERDSPAPDRPARETWLLQRARVRRLLLDFEGALADARRATQSRPEAAFLLELLATEQGRWH